MREQVRDKERLEHILHAIDTLLEYKQKYAIDEVMNNPIFFLVSLNMLRLLEKPYIS